MGFFKKTLAVNFNLGDVESPDFPLCKLTRKNNKMLITYSAFGKGVPDYYFEQKDIYLFELVACGFNFSKYRIVFNDGKSAIITQYREARSSIAPLERFIKEKRPENKVENIRAVSKQYLEKKSEKQEGENEQDKSKELREVINYEESIEDKEKSNNLVSIKTENEETHDAPGTIEETKMVENTSSAPVEEHKEEQINKIQKLEDMQKKTYNNEQVKIDSKAGFISFEGSTYNMDFIEKTKCVGKSVYIKLKFQNICNVVLFRNKDEAQNAYLDLEKYINKHLSTNIEEW